MIISLSIAFSKLREQILLLSLIPIFLVLPVHIVVEKFLPFNLQNKFI